LIPVVVVIAACVLFALSTNDVVLGVSLVFFISLGGDHVLEVGHGARAATTEVFGLLVSDVDYGGALVEEAPHVLA
jgi:hypothetical protein